MVKLWLKSSLFWFGIAGLLVLAVGIGVTVWQWSWLHGTDPSATASTTLRNMGLLIGGGIAAVFAIWRGWVAERQSMTAQRQAEIADRNLLNERYQRGAAMLGDEVLSVRMAGIYALHRLAEEYPDQHHIQIMQLFCSFVTNPPKPGEPRELPSGQAANAEQATGQDVRAAMYALGKRGEVGKALEEEAEVRLDLRSASLVGCDLSEMDFSNALLGGADLTVAYLVNCKLHRADLRQAIFTRARLGEANLSGANLYKTNLSRATCDDANFDSASISGSNLYGATLKNATLIGTWFHNAVLVNTSLKGADLSGAYFSTEENELAASSLKSGLTQDQLNEARWDENNPPKLNGLRDANTLDTLVTNGNLTPDASLTKEPPEGAK